MRTSCLGLAVAVGLGSLVASPVEAGPKKTPAKGAPAAPACGVKILPLLQGASWTYGNVASPTPPDEKIAKLSPPPAKQIVITVTAIETKGPDTVVTLEEKITNEVNVPSVGSKTFPPKLVERTVTSTITCNAKKFEISPESFLFAGEPGGFLSLTFDKLERPRGSTWQLTAGTIGEAEWREDIIGHWTRKPTEGSGVKPTSGKVELERKFTPQQPELVVGKADQWKAEKLGLVTTGRITLEQAHPENKPMELPAAWTTQLWLVENLGLVQVLNNYAHMYQLLSSSQSPTPPATPAAVPKK